MKHKSAFALLVLVAVAMTACTPSGFIIQKSR